MRLFVLALFASSLFACAPKTCAPKPVPEEYAEIAALLPSGAVVCAENPNPNGLFLNFGSRDVKKLTYQTMIALKKASWALDATSSAEDSAGEIMATKGNQRLHVGIYHQNGGPYVGRITGNVVLQTTSATKR